MQGLPLTIKGNTLWGKTAFNVNLLDWTRSKNTTFSCMILAVNDTFFLFRTLLAIRNFHNFYLRAN